MRWLSMFPGATSTRLTQAFSPRVCADQAAAQLNSKRLTRSVHTPPFKHGADSHSLISANLLHVSFRICLFANKKASKKTIWRQSRTCFAMFSGVSGCTLTLTRLARVHCLTAIFTWPPQARTVIHIYMQEQQTTDINLCLLYCNKMWVRSYNSPANVLIMWWCSLCDDAHYVMMFKRSSYLRTHVSSSIPPLALVTSRLTLLRRATDMCFCQVPCWLTRTMTFDDTPLHIWLKSFLLWRHVVLRSDVYS